MGNGALKTPEDYNEDDLDRSNVALVFVKPHANKENIREFVKAGLLSRGLSILAEGDLSAAQIEADGMIDTHYAGIAKGAMVTLPSEIPITDEKKAEFNKTFGSSWDDNLEMGLIQNAKGACEKLGTMNGDDLVPLDGQGLNTVWQAAKERVKLGPGMYVSQIGSEDEPLYCINGFYAAMRDKYVKGVGIRYYAVGWGADNIPWSKFRGELIGATDPTTAAATSIRGELLAQWEDLGLPACPDTGDNGIHASAGPLEGLKERMTWMGLDIKSDPFGGQLLSWTDNNEDRIKGWLNDEVVEEKNSGEKGKIFDLTEDKDTGYCLMFCNNLANV